MSSSDNIIFQRRWMYNHIDSQTRCVSAEFQQGLCGFMEFASQHMYEGNKMWCPCKKCQNQKLLNSNRVWTHLYNKGFTPNYYVWTGHGEEVQQSYEYENNEEVGEENDIQQYGGEWNYYGDFGGSSYTGVYPSTENVERNDGPAFEETGEIPNIEAARFFSSLESVNQPLYDGCVEGLSKFSLAADVMHVKTKHNLAEECVDDISRIHHHILPEDNVAAESYYETEKLMRTLSMPFHRIDVCPNNCMIYWSEEDKNLMECKFCKTPRYKPEKKLYKRLLSKNKRIPYKRMFYLPLSDRLKRLYLSKKTAPQMRWHAEHTSNDGIMQHPSDAKAWKHFNQVYPEFAENKRNIYLGLCTDGFNPFGMSGGSYSLWPIILTPYNLPPDMCMKREFLFLTILVPGRNHPKRSLDIFMQPLIEELQDLWSIGVEAFDVSVKINFNLKAVLLWTISDFPAYGMLSGWTTHGRLACPYCMDDTDAFQLRHGRKSSWFDCHRRFLPENHIFRKNTKSFRAGYIVTKHPPESVSGVDILSKQLERIYGLHKTNECGGNGHNNNSIDGYGVNHNWHKRSIFWDLPYWKTHLIRHNLDVMHIEKNFFDNITNTLFNVQGKTKDSTNSRKDLPLYCDRKSLHITSSGNVPIPIFRLRHPQKSVYLKWLKHDVKFSDGYASNISRCINEDANKIYGLKSHDSHVLMQRIYPFAFAELLPHTVHEVISDVALFFRDLCARNLTNADVSRLKKNIIQTLCNLEKIFLPSFFDVMEHLTVHLPMEAELGGPVQFRWMYPFERFMFHLKKKVKNKANVEGSIVEEFVNEEITNFTSRHFDTPGTILSNGPPKRHAAGYSQQTTYMYDVPEIFCHVGSGTGKAHFEWLSDEDYHIVHTYILLNCQELQPYERLFDEYSIENYPWIPENMRSSIKQREYSTWLKTLVESDYNQTMYPLWLQELVRGPIRKCTCWNKYFSRGYNFHTVRHGEHKSTTNYGVCARGSSGDEQNYYGKLQEILQIAYHGAVGLKVTLFRCDWYDTTIGRGTRMRKDGVIEVCASGVYENYDPFILTTQADQVCFLSYPPVKRRKDEWLVVIKITPRGILEESGKQSTAMQEDNSILSSQVSVLNVSSLVLPGEEFEDIPDDPESDDEDEFGSDIEMTDSESSVESESSDST